MHYCIFTWFSRILLCETKFGKLTPEKLWRHFWGRTRTYRDQAMAGCQPMYQQHRGPSKRAQHKWFILAGSFHHPWRSHRAVLCQEMWKAKCRRPRGWIHTWQRMDKHCYPEKVNPRILLMPRTHLILSQMICEAKASKDKLMVWCWIWINHVLTSLRWYEVGANCSGPPGNMSQNGLRNLEV